MNIQLFSSFESPALLVLKVAALIFLFLYLAFAAILIKQVKIMTDTLEVGLEGLIKVIVFIHFVFALGVFLLSIFIL
jgi:hypothetical protein